MNATDIQKIVLLEISGTSQFPDGFQGNYRMHLYCHRGNFEFKFNNQMHQCKAGDFVFWFANSDVSEMSNSKSLKAIVLPRLNLDSGFSDFSLIEIAFNLDYPSVAFLSKFSHNEP